MRIKLRDVTEEFRLFFNVVLPIVAAVLAVALLFQENFGLLILLLLGAGFIIVWMVIRIPGGYKSQPESKVATTDAKTTTPADPEPKAELQPESAPARAATEKGSVMTSPSNHPLAGKTGAFVGIVGFILDLVVASALFYFLAGWVSLPSRGVPLFGLEYPWELMAVAAALIYYWLSVLFSVNRERSPGWAKVDWSGTALVLIVLVGAALSFHPMAAAFYTRFNLPTVAYNSVNVAVLVFFGVATIAYFIKYHLKRAEVGLDAIETGKIVRVNVPPARIENDAGTAPSTLGESEPTVTTGRTVVIHGDVHNLVVADPNQVVRVWPKAATTRELKVV